MTRSSLALAAESRASGVLLHGMPGGGKTACALELAYTHEHAFDRLVWFKAPDEGMDISGALTAFALTLERDLPGFELIHVLANDTKLTAFLPRLTELLERSRLLIVIDNAESLLTDTGQWRDLQWGKVFGALTGHAGFGRVIMTSRRVPAGASGLQIEAVDALSLDEALLLARELPNLCKLIYGGHPGIDRDTSRRLARGVLNVAQGHPKLLELADGQASISERLTALTEAGDQAWQDQGGLPDGFFTTGETSADPSDYLQVLAAWTESVTSVLSPGERDLFWFLCCLEDPDRERAVVEPLWPRLWHRLGRDGQPPLLDQELAELAARGLTAIRAAGSNGESYQVHVHPGVAAAGRDQAGHGFQTAVDNEASAFWHAGYLFCSGKNDDSSVNTALMVRAGLAAVPYLLRQEGWYDAAALLENAFMVDPTRANAAALLPAITRIVDHDPRHAGTLTEVLWKLDPATAETRLRAHLDEAAARGDYRAASVAAEQLADLCQNSGRLAEALTLIDRKADYTRQAGLGPWTQLYDQVHRLQILNDTGHAGQVLHEVRRLRHRMDALRDRRDPSEAMDPWRVPEALLETGRSAAIDLGRWQDALDFGAEIIASQHARRAPAGDTARSRFHDYYPLLRLARTGQALDLLLECRQVFRDTGDIQMLGNTLSALADTEDQRDHGDAAIRLQCDALRYGYLAAEVSAIASRYHNLGGYLAIHARQPAAALAAHLAAALIRTHTGIGNNNSAAGSIRDAAADLIVFGAGAKPPADIADLCGRLAAIEGTDLPALIKKLSPDPETTERALRDLIAQARQLAQTRPGDADHG
jgi:hypothetical protein